MEEIENKKQRGNKIIVGKIVKYRQLVIREKIQNNGISISSIPSGQSKDVGSNTRESTNERGRIYRENEEDKRLLDNNGNTLTKKKQKYFKDTKVVDDNGKLIIFLSISRKCLDVK